MSNIELCVDCDEPTGRAGAGDDSIYLDTAEGAVGPLCLNCYHTRTDIEQGPRAIIAALRADLASERMAHAETMKLLQKGETLREGMPARIAILEAALRDLLARIHRDGGDHTAAVGLSTSIADAHATWAARAMAIDAAEARAAGLEAALRRAHDAWDRKLDVTELASIRTQMRRALGMPAPLAVPAGDGSPC